MDAPLLAVLKGERRDPPPVWLMRQAGRWLPEYRALRAEAGGFLNMVYVPERAVEITLQPVRRFAMDGAILFSDILVVPHALGQELSFVEGEGPRLAPALSNGDLTLLHECPHRLDPVYQTVRRLRAALPAEVALIGFAGSPWTVATYMVAGEGEREPARALAYRDPAAFAALIERLAHATIAYLRAQVEAGAQAVQLFDSWSGALAADQFDRWVIEPTARIVEALHAVCPGVPVIGFPRGAGHKLARYAQATGVDAIGIDETIDPDWAHGVLPPGLPVQGNVDNLALVAGGAALEAAVARCLAAFRHRPHVFNLGHGCVPATPIAHVEAMLAQVRSLRA